MKQDQYDVVIVGAGHNGLVAGGYLQRAGLNVLVLERNPHIGGATTSISRYKDYIYSNTSYVYSLFRQEIARERAACDSLRGRRADHPERRWQP
jgi:phytoene dehydrogenase-like protein